MFITFEGIEGAGKSTAIASVADGLERRGRRVLLTQEPGGCALGKTLRTLLLDQKSVIASRAELFLFLADRIIRRLGIRKTMCLLGIMTALRWGNSFLAASTGQLFITQGLNFVIILENVTIAILISRQVQPEVKTVAQTLVATIQGVVGILISSMAGGMLADAVGIRPLFLIAAGIALFTAVLFFFLLHAKNREILSPQA